MAFFSSKEKDTGTKVQPSSNNAPKAQSKPSTATTISKGINITGNLSGSDSVQVDGILDGNIEVDNVIIGRSGVVNGTIKAKNVTVEGELKGEIYCSDLEIAKQGKVSHKIYAINLSISGSATGDIVSEKTITVSREGTVQAQKVQSQKIVINGSIEGKVNASELIEVGHDGKVKTDRLESKKVVVNGKIDGKMTASELLEVGKNGFVQGEITIKNIKTEEGGRVIGTMVTYQETIKEEPVQETEVIDTETA